MLMFVWNWRAIGKRVGTHGGAIKGWNCQWELTSAKILDLI